MENNSKNFYIALALSAMVFLVWHFVFVVPKQEAARQRQLQEAQLKKAKEKGDPVAPEAGGLNQPKTPEMIETPLAPKDRKSVLTSTKRVEILTPSLKGSLSLKGARIDDISLLKHRQSVEKSSPPVVLFSPIGTAHPFLVDLGWSSAAASAIQPPTRDSEWTLTNGTSLTPSSPITIEYDAGSGVVFQRDISVDENYRFTIKQRVINKSAKPLQLAAYGYIWRRNRPHSQSLFISHEGAVGVFDGELQEESYDDLEDGSTETFKAKTGWTAITDKYWAAALIPDQKLNQTTTFQGDRSAKGVTYRTTYLLNTQEIAAGETIELTNRLFAGAKRGTMIEDYAATYKIERFENLIDWGWFDFITKPLFHALVYINNLVHNFGVAILIVTVLIKLLLFPLANKSYKSMAQMKKMQPEMERIRKRYENDKMKQQQELMALYKKEKINPLSGCWPILVQIPVFFALYKVLYVTIEMRHAPFFGWIQDLSAPDPTSIFNLFGLIPIELPLFLMIGVWPIIMGLTMWVQMKLNPAPADPVQAKIFAYMPIVFTFILAGFSAGLVIYWAWNNFLSIIQQYVIMKRQGVEVTLLENMGFKKNTDEKA